MFIRSLARARRATSHVSMLRRPPALRCSACRRFSSSGVPPSPSTSMHRSQASILGTVTADLDDMAPRFELESSQIHILKTPAEFYQTLKDKISRAERRIYISTLYIGKNEDELISTIRSALQRNPHLQVSILTDALRGTREAPEASCASLLAPLITEFGSDRVQVRMFHTPNLTGLRKRFVPQRINEGWGLQHMKLYSVDDEVIISGANLSSDYFTNRQDRYHLFSSKDLTSYFFKVHSSVCRLSFRLIPSSDAIGFALVWPDSNPSPSPLQSPDVFQKCAMDVMEPHLGPSTSPTLYATQSGLEKPTSIVYPVLSLPSLVPETHPFTELPVLTKLLTRLSVPPLHPSTWTFTAGYFNTTPSLQRLLLWTRPHHGTVLTAHPLANGFFGSAGLSGMLPAAYTHLSKEFMQAIRRQGLHEDIEVREWKRGSPSAAKGEKGDSERWTYHAKGIWVSLPEPEPSPDDAAAAEPDPSITVVGSSNYTKRSYELDLEANVLIASTDPSVRRRLGEEVRWLGEFAEKVDENEFKKPERRVGVGVRLAMWAVRALGGAL